MNKFYLGILITIILLPFGLKATHIYGGQITATAESCQNNTYTITVTAYEEPGSDVEFGNGLLSLGFGEVIDISSENDFLAGAVVEYDDNLARVSKLTFKNVAFPGPGAYTITFQDFNRNADVVNIRNSVRTPFYVESQLVVDPLLCNSTPLLSDTANFIAYTGSVFQQTYRATDPDGDSLSVELVIPKQSAEDIVTYYGSPLDIDLRYADNPTNAAGSGLPTLTINSELLEWDAPNLPGEFTVAFQVNEWRKVNGEWELLGYVTRDMTIQVLDTINNTAHTDIITSTTQEEPDKPEIQLFPNPNQGDFTLEIKEDIWGGATASLHNIIGLEIDRRTVSLGENSYSIPECQPGIYFLTLQQGDLQRVLRFVKR